MKGLVAPALLAGGLLFGGLAALAPGSAAAQARLDPRTGEWERLGRAEFERGHRAGREDERRSGPRRRERAGETREAERDHFARHGFDDPWFSYGYGYGPHNTGPFDLSRLAWSGQRKRPVIPCADLGGDAEHGRQVARGCGRGAETRPG